MKDKNLILVLIIAGVFLMAGILNATNGDLVVKGSFNLLPPGTIMMYGGPAAPQGWLPADGSEVSRTEYSTLFAAIGTTFGQGDGLTTFNLPDFRRRVPVGSGGTGTPVLGNAVGNTGGEEMHLLTAAESGLPSHAHSITGGIGASPSACGQGAGCSGPYSVNVNASTAKNAAQAHNNLPPSIVVNYIIKS